MIGVGYSTDEGYWLIRNSWGRKLFKVFISVGVFFTNIVKHFLTLYFHLVHMYYFTIVSIPARWGDKGYIKLSMESDNPSHIGQCGVYKAVATVIVE